MEQTAASVIIKVPTQQAEKGLYDLYKIVAAQGSGIARTTAEITAPFITNIFKKVEADGLLLVACVRTTNEIIGAIHASGFDLYIFRHVLTNFTVLVHPQWQGKGIGKKLFLHFLQTVKTNFPHIGRIELEARASNKKSIDLYKSVGFVEEGRMKNKTKNAGGSFEDSILLAWINPDFTFN